MIWRVGGQTQSREARDEFPDTLISLIHLPKEVGHLRLTDQSPDLEARDCPIRNLREGCASERRRKEDNTSSTLPYGKIILFSQMKGLYQDNAP